MGVLACNRKGCENIMCDMYSTLHGYICHECYVELRDKPGHSITEFMNTPKCEDVDNETREAWENHLKQLFRSRHDE